MQLLHRYIVAAGGGALAVAAVTAMTSPYPELKRPSVEECWFARDALAQLHSTFFAKYEGGQGGHIESGPGSLPAPPATADAGGGGGVVAAAAAATAPAPPLPRKCVLDSLVGTILSQNTTDTNSHRAFAALKRRFPTWESVRVAPPASVEEAVKCGGLAEIKVARVHVILNTLVQERGKACMEYLREMDDEAAKKELSRFKGVGPKTVSVGAVTAVERSVCKPFCV
jgi:endonuclease-3